MMIILHGIYNNGKVEIKEKELPNGQAKFEIVLTEEKLTDKNQLLFDYRGKFDIDSDAIEKLRRESRV